METALWKGKKVLIMGLGLHGGGVGAARFFAKKGAVVTVTDLKTERDLALSIKKLEGLGIRYVLGKHDVKDFTAADRIIKNPAVRPDSPYIRAAHESGVTVDTDVSFFFTHSPSFIIGVTGTKGKSTTTALAAHFLKALGVDAHATWLPGTSVFDALDTCGPTSVAVVELASWEIESLIPYAVSPHVAVLTTIFPDHLNWHGTFKAYRDAKAGIFAYQKPEDRAVLNYDDEVSRTLVPRISSTVWGYSGDCANLPPGRGVCATADAVIVHNGAREERMERSQMSGVLAGDHNFHNILAALGACAAAVSHPKFPASVPFNLTVLGDALHAFHPLTGRLEYIREKENVQFMNDTAATNPGATIAALRTLGNVRPVILIAGGEDKDLSYRELAHEIKRYVKTLVLFSGSASDKLTQELSLAGWQGDLQTGFSNMEDAVRAANAVSRPGDMVLLSPGAASFNHFAHEFARGKAFVDAVVRLP